MATDKHHKFKAIVVGGGPTGLILAHALTAAGIDLTLLESHHSFETDNPSVTALWPHTLRVFDQLGLLDDVIKAETTSYSKRVFSSEGKLLWETQVAKLLTDWHGRSSMIVLRHRLMDILSKDLKYKPNVKTRKRVETICSHPDGGIEVTCTDGTTETGDIVIGADGPWSIVRQHITEALRCRGLPSDPDKPFTTSFTGIFCRAKQSPATSQIPINTFFETRGADVHFQGLADDEYVNFAVCHRLPVPTSERSRYTQEDIDAQFEQFSDRVVINGVKLRDLAETKTYNWMTNIEEGRLHHWYDGRMVLVGDSTHKMGPQAGFGLNLGMQGVVELVNRLRVLLADEGGKPDDASLTAVFQGYQDDMKKHEDKFNELSAAYVRQVSLQGGWVFSLLDRFVFPYCGGDKFVIKYLVAPNFAEGRILYFLEEKNEKHGSMPWKNMVLAKP